MKNLLENTLVEKFMFVTRASFWHLDIASKKRATKIEKMKSVDNSVENKCTCSETQKNVKLNIVGISTSPHENGRNSKCALSLLETARRAMRHESRSDSLLKIFQKMRCYI